MTPYEIPLEPRAQQFQIQMSGVTYTLRFTWCNPSSCWLLDLMTVDEQPILLSLPVQTGVDILAQHRHLGIPGQLWVQTDGDLGAVPQYPDLGLSGHLYYLAED